MQAGDLFSVLIDIKPLLVEFYPFDQNFSSLMQFFAAHIYMTDDMIGITFFETFEGLDEEICKLVCFQFKLDIESYFAGSPTNIDWEQMRYDDIQNYFNVTLYGHCIECHESLPLTMAIFAFLKLPLNFVIDSNENPPMQRIDCPKCGMQRSFKIFRNWLYRTPEYRFKLSNTEVKEIEDRWNRFREQDGEKE